MASLGMRRLSSSRACLKNHSRNLHALLCGIFHPNSAYVARYDALIRAKSPTNCDAHFAESLFQTRFSIFLEARGDSQESIQRGMRHERIIYDGDHHQQEAYACV